MNLPTIQSYVQWNTFFKSEFFGVQYIAFTKPCTPSVICYSQRCFQNPVKYLRRSFFAKIDSGIYPLIFSNKRPYLKAVDLLTFTEETRNTKLHFLCSEIFSILFEKRGNTETIAYISIDVTSSISLTVAICLRNVSHNHFFFFDDLIKLA